MDTHSRDGGPSITVSFTGTYLAWITRTGQDSGIANVSLDGGPPQAIDLYSASNVYQQKVWDTGFLSSGTHTVRIEWTGQKNAASTDTYISVDAFDVVGVLR